nr:invasion associated locus B family protein [Bradyrhizobium mercantei]
MFTIFGLAGLGHAQAPKGKNAPAPAAAAAPAAPPGDAASPNNSGWVARCTSASREAPLECAMEQTAVLSKTGQLIVLVNIRVPGDTRAPMALIQLPLGLNLPVGAKLQVDDGKAVDVPIQTCEARGCYINAPIAADVLSQLKSGKQLKVSFQNLGKETISIPMPLGDFATVYDKIK